MTIECQAAAAMDYNGEVGGPAAGEAKVPVLPAHASMPPPTLPLLCLRTYYYHWKEDSALLIEQETPDG